jgi:hypothetical protein
MNKLSDKIIGFLLEKNNLFRLVVLLPLVLVAFLVSWAFISFDFAMVLVFYSALGIIITDLLSIWIEYALRVTQNLKEALKARVSSPGDTISNDRATRNSLPPPANTDFAGKVKMKSRKSLVPAASNTTVTEETAVVKKRVSARGRPKSIKPKES